MKHLIAALFIAVLASATAGLATASSPSADLGNETVTYSYDALGRLTGSTTAGGPNNSRTTGTCFDHAGNRMRYDVATSAPSTCPTPTPTPTP
jgi:YD repeat-containing protein